MIEPKRNRTGLDYALPSPFVTEPKRDYWENHGQNQARELRQSGSPLAYVFTCVFEAVIFQTRDGVGNGKPN